LDHARATSISSKKAHGFAYWYSFFKTIPCFAKSAKYGENSELYRRNVPTKPTTTRAVLFGTLAETAEAEAEAAAAAAVSRHIELETLTEQLRL
jgi:hypothetical protein